ncbi:MAG: bacteriocin biosynthesis protein [Catenulispora sp.]|nr:bacteriocin biosynthesis protein [Catenulispora sp.]
MTSMTATWHTVHVYYHAADKDSLLLDAVRPLLERIKGLTEAAYVVPHWRQGPHLRLNIRTDEERWRDVRPRIDEIVGGHLRDHPSTAVLDQDSILRRHRLLAVREQEIGPLTPWPPDNSIQDAPFDPRRHVLGSEAAVELLTSFYTDSTELLFAMLEHVRDGRDDKGRLGMNLMLTVAHTAAPITRSFVSYRAHAEGYLTWAADPAASRAAFDRAYADRRTELTGRVRAVIAALDDPAAPAVPFVREWAGLLAAYRARITPLLDSGELPLPMTDPAAPNEAAPRLGGVPVPQRLPGELHQLILTSPAYHRAVFEQPAFLNYRVLLNYTYLHLTRMGLTPLDRFRLCHLTANAVEDAYGLSAVELIRRSVEAG